MSHSKTSSPEHSKTPYSPNFPAKQGYAHPPEDDRDYPSDLQQRAAPDTAHSPATHSYPPDARAAQAPPYPPPSHVSSVETQMEPAKSPHPHAAPYPAPATAPYPQGSHAGPHANQSPAYPASPMKMQIEAAPYPHVAPYPAPALAPYPLDLHINQSPPYPVSPMNTRMEPLAAPYPHVAPYPAPAPAPYPSDLYSNRSPAYLHPPIAAQPPHASPTEMQSFKQAYRPDFAPVPPGCYPPPPQPTFNPAYGYPHPPPVTHQPQLSAPGGWMTMPQGVLNCPPGLEYLSMIDQILVHQQVELLEAFTGFETANKYEIKNSVGQDIYYAEEESECCARMVYGPLRSFEMMIYDNLQNEVIHLHRPLGCGACCFPCCLQRVEVTSPPGHIVGFVEQERTLCTPRFMIKNAAGEVVLRIKGPICTISICGDVEFNVYSKDGENIVGTITKQWSGLAREAFTDSDFFGITFPMDLDVKIKATLLGACFLIDFMYYEKSEQHERLAAALR